MYGDGGTSEGEKKEEKISPTTIHKLWDEKIENRRLQIEKENR